MAFKPKRNLVKPIEVQKVEQYQYKVDYHLYCDNPEDVKTLRECEEKLAFTGGKMAELIEVRRKAIQQMKTILKEQKIFLKVMAQLGISREMIFDVTSREKLYLKYDTDREFINNLTTREVRTLNKYEFSQAEIDDIKEDKKELKRLVTIKEKLNKGSLEQQRKTRIDNLLAEREKLLNRLEQIKQELEKLNHIEKED